MGALLESVPELKNPGVSMKRHILIGMAAGILLILFYAGILTLLQGKEHALSQTVSQWYWILALAAGFGVQSGLFSFIRRSLRQRQASAKAGVVASGSVSAGSMVACCAHHLSDILPVIGIYGISAFLIDYQLFFIVIGILANLVGITVMLETIQRNGLCQRLVDLSLDMRLIKKGTVIAAIMTMLALFFTR